MQRKYHLSIEEYEVDDEKVEGGGEITVRLDDELAYLTRS